MVSSGDNGSLRFWDYETGYCFQKTDTVVQPGSIDWSLFGIIYHVKKRIS
jgi:hypothetical protein